MTPISNTTRGASVVTVGGISPVTEAQGHMTIESLTERSYFAL
jgi:hypothetical protein